MINPEGVFYITKKETLLTISILFLIIATPIVTAKELFTLGIPFKKVWEALNDIIERLNRIEEKLEKIQNTPVELCYDAELRHIPGDIIDIEIEFTDEENYWVVTECTQLSLGELIENPMYENAKLLSIIPRTEPNIPNPKIIKPEEDASVSGVTLVAATDLNDVLPEHIISVDFFYSNDGIDWYSIGSARDIDLLYWENSWDTSGLDAGEYKLKVTVEADSGTYEDEIEVHVNREPVPIFGTRLSRNRRYAIFDGSGSYDPDGAIDNYLWKFSDDTILHGQLVSYPIPHHMEPDSMYEFYLEYIVYDNEETFYTNHSIIRIRYGPHGLPYEIEVIPKSCGCDSMQIKNTGNSSYDMWWMPAGKKKQLGGYNNINMTTPGNPSFQIVHNFEVIATLFPHSDQSKCSEGQKVKRTFHTAGTDYNKTYNESVNYAITPNIVTCPFGGGTWCDDDYHTRDDSVKFYVNQSKIIWLDGPGHDNVRKSWFNPDGTSYKANFAAMVWGPLGSCECTWDLIWEVAQNGTVTKNGIENLICV